MLMPFIFLFPMSLLKRKERRCETLTKYRQSDVCFACPFPSLDRICTGDRCGLLVGGETRRERGFSYISPENVSGLDVCALKHAELAVDLIKPGGVERHPTHLDVPSEIADPRMFAEPPFEWCGRVRHASVHNEDHRFDRNDHLVHNGLDIDSTHTASAGSVDCAIGNGTSGTRVAHAVTRGTCGMEDRLAGRCRVRWLLTLACGP
jgi:hypothetical protein